MKTYLLTWNPSRWQFDGLADFVDEISLIGETRFRWSTGVTKSISLGDRVFLIRLGVMPKGIIGSGFASTNNFTDPHWDKKRQAAAANYIGVVWDVLSEQPLVSEKELTKLPKYNWFPQTSGVTIPPSVSRALEILWRKKTKSSNSLSLEYSSMELIEGHQRISTGTFFERNSLARELCIKRLGYSCSICGINFENTYGPVGKEYIHVHHLKPISQIKHTYKIDPQKDLVTVCPNCHVMLHRTIPPQTISQLKAAMKKVKS